MKKMIIFVSLMLTIQVLALQQSPGFQLFNSIVDTLLTEYINPKNVDVAKITSKYRGELIKLCSKEKNCQLDIARKVVFDMLSSFGDPHLALYNKKTPQLVIKILLEYLDFF
jgi:hypothetical protein